MSEVIHPLEAEVTLVTSFQDADPMGVIYHGNYFRFFEEARRVMMEKIDYGYTQMTDSGYVWPVIDVQVKYIRAIPFNHPIRIHATLVEWENRLRVNYTIFDAQTGKRMCKGHTTQVAVGAQDKEMRLASPSVFTSRVDQWHQFGAYQC